VRTHHELDRAGGSLGRADVDEEFAAHEELAGEF
jgi:hypothetical protein